MKVKVESCHSGPRKGFFRLSFRHDGEDREEYVEGREWEKNVSAAARDLLSKTYGVTRKWIKFTHR